MVQRPGGDAREAEEGSRSPRARVWRAGQTVKVLKGWGRMPHEPWEYRTVLMFEPRDCWVGLYWDRRFIYVCLLPCLPLRVQYRGSFS